MDKYIFDEKNGLWYELQGRLLYSLPYFTNRKRTQAYRLMGGCVTSATYRNINGRFTPRYSQAEN